MSIRGTLVSIVVLGLAFAIWCATRPTWVYAYELYPAHPQNSNTIPAKGRPIAVWATNDRVNLGPPGSKIFYDRIPYLIGYALVVSASFHGIGFCFYWIGRRILKGRSERQV